MSEVIEFGRLGAEVHSPLRVSFSIGRACCAVALAAVLVVITAAPAFATKGWVQGRHPTYRYGCSANILVNNAPSYVMQKVCAIWTYRTDEAAYCETGVTWDVDRYRPYAFWSLGQNGIPGATHSLGEVTEYSYPLFHTGYVAEYSKHLFWYNNVVVARESIPSMTSCWPGTNSETESNVTGDHSARFKNLKYKSASTWSTWAPFTNIQEYYDNVPYYYFYKRSNTEHSVLHV